MGSSSTGMGNLVSHYFEYDCLMSSQEEWKPREVSFRDGEISSAADWGGASVVGTRNAMKGLEFGL